MSKDKIDDVVHALADADNILSKMDEIIMAADPERGVSVIDLGAKVGDFRFECPKCHWGVTLRPEGAA